MQKPEITAYLKTYCGWSAGVRAVLAKYNLPYTEKDIIQNPAFITIAMPHQSDSVTQFLIQALLQEGYASSVIACLSDVRQVLIRANWKLLSKAKLNKTSLNLAVGN